MTIVPALSHNTDKNKVRNFVKLAIDFIGGNGHVPSTCAIMHPISPHCRGRGGGLLAVKAHSLVDTSGGRSKPQ